jgi:rhodanese-related sulfurtransferase
MNREPTKHLLIRRGLLAAMLIISAAVHAEPVKTDIERAKALMAGGVPLIDVRTPREWAATGVIQGSHLLTFFDESGRYDWQAWRSQLAGIAGTDEPVILVCQQGARSNVIADALAKSGYSQVYDLSSGMQGWLAQDNPTVAP